MTQHIPSPAEKMILDQLTRHMAQFHTRIDDVTRLLEEKDRLIALQSENLKAMEARLSQVEASLLDLMPRLQSLDALLTGFRDLQASFSSSDPLVLPSDAQEK